VKLPALIADFEVALLRVDRRLDVLERLVLDVAITLE
jgi:hypothetical protein